VKGVRYKRGNAGGPAIQVQMGVAKSAKGGFQMSERERAGIAAAILERKGKKRGDG